MLRVPTTNKNEFTSDAHFSLVTLDSKCSSLDIWLPSYW